MRRSVVIGLLVGGLLPARVSASAPGAAPPAPDATCPVVLELFTSQGCSSCPPADAVLSHLGMDDKTRDKVVPLAFHVDYWNRVGWTDPFSAPRWSQRQEAYSRVFGPDSVYTPQLVVNGRTHLNGGQGQRVLAEVMAELPCTAAAAVGIAARSAAGQPMVVVDATAEMVRSVRSGKLELLVALFENGVTTPVERGENRGRNLRNDFIVRRLETAFSLEPRAGERKRREWNLRLDAAWQRVNLGVAAFLQDPKSMRIFGSASQLVP